jgi:hypothetical protein
MPDFDPTAPRDDEPVQPPSRPRPCRAHKPASAHDPRARRSLPRRDRIALRRHCLAVERESLVHRLPRRRPARGSH